MQPTFDEAKNNQIKNFYSSLSPNSFTTPYGDAILDIETTGLSPWDGRIVSIGLKTSYFEEIFYDVDEKKMLQDFWDFCITNKINRFIGWNVQFDCSFLRVRSAIKHNLPVPFFRFLDMRYAISYGDRFYKGTMGEVELCLGIADEYKLAPQISGKDCPALYETGEVQRILDHNLDDIRSEYLMFERMSVGGLIYEKQAEGKYD